jgi:hypothetical protein
MEKVLLYYEIFNLIPVGLENRISTTALLNKLNNKGCNIGLQKLQRALRDISATHGLFPLCCEQGTGAKPSEWFWIERLQFPMMSIDEAITFKLAEMFVEPVLPITLRDRLEDYFKQADKRLEEGGLGHWKNKFKVVLPENNLSVSTVMKSLSVISDSLIHNRQFKASFFEQNHNIEAEYMINPLGMVLNLGNIYIVATIDDDIQIKKLPLYIFKSVTLKDTPAIIPEGFDLENYT